MTEQRSIHMLIHWHHYYQKEALLVY